MQARPASICPPSNGGIEPPQVPPRAPVRACSCCRRLAALPAHTHRRHSGPRLANVATHSAVQNHIRINETAPGCAKLTLAPIRILSDMAKQLNWLHVLHFVGV